MVRKRVEYGIQARKKREEVMKVFDKMQRSGKIEVDKDLEEKLGFSLTAMPKHD